jgi:hypothetical protein
MGGNSICVRVSDPKQKWPAPGNCTAATQDPSEKNVTFSVWNPVLNQKKEEQLSIAGLHMSDLATDSYTPNKEKVMVKDRERRFIIPPRTCCYKRQIAEPCYLLFYILLIVLSVVLTVLVITIIGLCICK